MKKGEKMTFVGLLPNMFPVYVRHDEFLSKSQIYELCNAYFRGRKEAYDDGFRDGQKSVDKLPEWLIRILK